MIEVYRNFLTHIKPIKQKNASSECSDASAFNGDTPLESLEFSNLELCQNFLRTSPELRQHKLHGIDSAFERSLKGNHSDNSKTIYLFIPFLFWSRRIRNRFANTQRLETLQSVDNAIG